MTRVTQDSDYWSTIKAIDSGVAVPETAYKGARAIKQSSFRFNQSEFNNNQDWKNLRNRRCP
jgi:hypothetical protein